MFLDDGYGSRCRLYRNRRNSIRFRWNDCRFLRFTNGDDFRFHFTTFFDAGRRCLQLATCVDIIFILNSTESKDFFRGFGRCSFGRTEH